MRNVRVDPEKRRAHVSGGALLGDLDHEAQAFGLVCPVGVISHTGAAGLTLGGGMGRLQRKFGLTIDNLLSADVVTADGRLVHASEDQNPELFWGLRGAGPNFGIVTSLEYRLHTLGRVITHGSVLEPIDRVNELAALFRDAVENGPDELGLGFGLGLAESSGDPVAFVNVLHCGSLADAERDLATLRSFEPSAGSIEAKPYLTTQTMNDGAMDWGQRFYMKSALLVDLPDDLIDRLAGRLPEIPARARRVLGLGDGACSCRGPEDATAYAGREATYWLAAEILWHDDADEVAELRVVLDDRRHDRACSH